MGIMDKVKNLFTEEVEDDRPIKKEVRHVEIPSPKMEESKPAVETKENEISDNPAVKNEEKFVFPVYFDDKDFDDLEKPKEEEKIEPKHTRNDKKREEPKLYNGGKEKEEVKELPKNFRPSLIISPVYGVLDKNYHKEDITTKQPVSDIYYKSADDMTVDDIRQKAYGTLEDELKNNVLGHEEILNEKRENTETAIDLFNELDFEEIDKENNSENNENNNNDLIFDNDNLDDDTALLAKQLEEQKRKLNEINDYIEENTVEKKPKNDIEDEVIKEDNAEIDEFIEESQADELMETENDEKSELDIQEETDEGQNPDLTESELFNLIDSMYDDKEEK